MLGLITRRQINGLLPVICGSDTCSAEARARGCRELKAITTASNERSLAFHRAFGMEPVGEDRDGEIPIARDYAGPGQDRVVLRMALIELSLDLSR
jgi:hypothetical protein